MKNIKTYESFEPEEYWEEENDIKSKEKIGDYVRMSDLYVGERVYDSQRGFGTVKKIHNGFKVFVCFDNILKEYEDYGKLTKSEKWKLYWMGSEFSDCEKRIYLVDKYSLKRVKK
ncbi:MAG: hypothetical protein KDH96_12185 [Candidatus Riesia sp.]|nr:hypothetical protein [Candidatus Riesia sp.]